MLRFLIRILRASLAQIDTEMAKYANQPHQRYAVSCRSPLEDMPQLDVSWSALMVLVTLTFHLVTLKLVCESHQRWGTFSLNLGTLVARPSGSRVIRYVRDGWTDGRTD